MSHSVDQLAEIIKGTEKLNNERFKKQDEWNESITKSIEKMADTVSNIQSIQTELNIVNSDVSDIRAKQEIQAAEIAKIKETDAGDRIIIDELKQWRILVFGGFATALIALAVNTFYQTEDPTAKRLAELTEIVEKMHKSEN